MEQWKDIIETNGKYSVSNKGRVRNNITQKIMRPSKYVNGYYGIGLMIDGKQKRYRVHRLVAEYFVPNPFNLPQVNHKDENKTNNSADNLEWCTASYNCSYGSKMKRTKSKISKKVLQMDLKNNVIKEYPSIIEASRQMHCSDRGIGRACTGEYKQYKGYKWRYSI